MTDRTELNGLKIAPELVNFVEKEVLDGLDIDAAALWSGFAGLVAEFAPRIQTALHERETLQQRLDAWHIEHRENDIDPAAYRAFLTEIGYLVPEGEDFQIATQDVDPEIAEIAGPQLVVPVTNARFALNAANARWGSLYDALYGTDALGDAPAANGYDAERGARVIAWGRAHLDAVAPLASGSWRDIDGLQVRDGALLAGDQPLADAGQFVGYTDTVASTFRILLRVNDLHIELVVDPSSTIGAQDAAGISDIRLESAMSAIMDCEDSVACVDAGDKVLAYRNWLGLMRGDLEESFDKNGKRMTRRLNADRTFIAPQGGSLTLKGRSLMLVRNVGHLMTNPAVLDANGAEIPETLMDAFFTVMAGMHDLRKTSGLRNSHHGSVYVVLPKMHGPQEVALSDAIFTEVERILGLARYTVKLGIMDEERRTSANLKETIRAARHRVAFINTGFLDRTGDEIHTSMEAGPMLPKGEMKDTAWINAYEDRNVDIGLACGLQGRAQIGKGMWAMPDRMADMLEAKIAHPEAGANCAWVPSPTAATLHATHYHRVNVKARQQEIAAGGPRASLDALLTIPLLAGRNLDPAEIQREVENNAQGILGYVVRWIDQGVGCSKVPDINDIGLMEDRATCRISSQALANWLHHDIVSETAVLEAMQKMAAVVDRQNSGDPLYRPLAPDFSGLAFQAACDLVFKGRIQPSGYTEPVLHARRLELKVAG